MVFYFESKTNANIPASQTSPYIFINEELLTAVDFLE